MAGDALYIRDFEDRPPENLIEVKRLALVLLMHNFYDQAWAMIDASERKTIIDATEAEALKQAVIDLCPEPKPYERTGRRGRRLYRLRKWLGYDDIQRVAAWSERTWPDQ